MIMKTTLTVLLTTAALSGCAGLTNSRFDAIEYSRYVDISTSARLAIKQCSDAASSAVNSRALAVQTDYAIGYSASKVQNKRITAAGEELQSLTQELVARYNTQTPSVGYCQLKLGQVSLAAETIATSIGKKEE